jgi:hypothetical protein
VLAFPSIKGGDATKFAPWKALSLIARCKLTVGGRVVVHRVAGVAPKQGAAHRVDGTPLQREIILY